MDYRSTSSHHNNDACSVSEDGEICARFQLDVLNDRFKDIAKRLLDDRDLAGFDPQYRRQSHSVFDLGTICDHAVIEELVLLDGYRKLHDSLKKINADFHFQVLPSAGMMRPTPCLLLIVEQYKNYASNMHDKNRHMYPGFSANDNRSLFKPVFNEGGDDISLPTVKCAPIHFNFS